MRSTYLKQRYNITEEDYQKLLTEQNGVCKLCGGPETRKDPKTGVLNQLAIDHCHDKNIIRGLLCGKCNRALGGFQDRVDLLQKAIDYLKSTETDKTPN